MEEMKEMGYMVLKNCIEDQGCYYPMLVDDACSDIETEDLHSAMDWLAAYDKLNNGRYVLVSVISDSEDIPSTDTTVHEG